jgi:hypothetical protein
MTNALLFRSSSFRLSVSAVFLAAIAGSPAQTAPPKTQKPVLAAWTEIVGDEHTAPYP